MDTSINTPSKNQPTSISSYPLTAKQIASYHSEGFLIARHFFDPKDELSIIEQEFEKDPDMDGAVIIAPNTMNSSYKGAVWTELDDSLLGVIPRLARMVEAAESLLNEECYHWHSKVVRKAPYSNALVDWHQDYAAWYLDGCLSPQAISCGIAVTKSTPENGCLQVIPKSHLWGRIDHKMKDVFLIDPIRLKLSQEKLGIVDCALEPGDAVFFHPNTIHGSGVNQTSYPRNMLFSSYNAVSNEPFIKENQEHHRYRPLQKVPDDWIKAKKYHSVLDKDKFDNWNWLYTESD